MDYFGQVLGLGWVYLATEGINTLASQTEKWKIKRNGHL
jgi:hypothetical protein